MEIKDYLDRIDFNDNLEVNKNTLFKLQKNHLLNIPFENLDIHYNKKISLSIPEIYQKIVVGKRGGFCYELNGLFHHLLIKIGFNAKLISARVHIKDEEYSPEYDHLCILVNLENQEFLVDVGFGSFSLEPLKLEFNKRVADCFGTFLFDKYAAEYYRINEIKNSEMVPQYIFKKVERELIEFKNRCKFHQTSQESHFFRKKVISKATEDGRITLTDSQLKRTHLKTKKEITFKEEEFENKLKQYFNIELKTT
ncbi:arylamine N-acetyltransferase [uncultured Croceitalea sp.]|uniref:arylamine N-acetyltransferase family protein n=1 Tax=uncultured Croceitalea sp. TaxID=1798908 RepID=UPI0033064D38